MRRLLAGVVAAAALTAALPGSVLAHGDDDARPLARGLEAGPHRISLWQVDFDSGTAVTPHLIVIFDSVSTAPPGVQVRVVVNGASLDVRRSTTTRNGFETAEGLDTGDVVTVSISDGTESWKLEPIVVPPPATSMLPMEELIYGSIFLTIGTAWWLASRTARAWRRPPATATGTGPAN